MNEPIHSVLNVGSGGLVVDIECHLSNGLPNIVIVGLGNKAIDEAKERVRSALASAKLELPRKRITINLAPADIPKDSTSLDLAISAAILLRSGQIKTPLGKNEAIIGELGLDGSVRPIRGIIGKMLAGRRHGIHTFFIPKANLNQAALVPGIRVIPLNSIRELVRHLNGAKPIGIEDCSKDHDVLQAYENDHLLSDVVGQERAKRALEIAAAGGHNLFLSGPPGTGKSMLAKALPSIMPPMSREEILEVTHLHSLATNNFEQLVTTRPFRSPHHSASHVAIVGGGNNIRPGEISMSHRGVLFLDEMPEFNRLTLESLRQPLEDRSITVSRTKDTVEYPACFTLVATANPCPCGYFGTKKACTCPAHLVAHYRQKISGPIMDRLDLYVDVDEVPHSQLLGAPNCDIVAIRKRILAARGRQTERYGNKEKLNTDLTNREIKTMAKLSPTSQELLNQAASRLQISARSYMRIIKVARTIADLADSDTIEVPHITEALQYRSQSSNQLA